MEVGDITTVASRKRISADVEQLRDKVSKETAKIIKLKVAQDTAYWDLKEKLHQVEGNHERLQQNMVEVQMQHETISGQYQEELRLRPETLNKVSGTREICSVLESYSLRLKDTLARCRGDHAALLEAMQRAGGALKTASEKTRVGETALKDMEERVKLTTEHQNQLLQLFSVTKQQSDKEIHELKVKLEAALQSKEELVHSLHEMNRKMDMCSFDIGKKEEAITNLQGDIKQLIQELSIQSSEAKNALDKQQKDLAAALEANFSLKNTIQEQESLIKNICEQKIGLEHKITVLENQQANDSTQIQDMKRQLQEAVEVNEKNKYNLGVLEQQKEKLAEEVEEKKKVLY
ncbi:myosin heavy chain, striated muscle-like [Danaus plexippus]|uniref:myosin heavy chain, striated muscle-like n=1 Tax=Danaus plexippus TaxID=13037 RepID=UPI002AB06422|nr:myosin heavy chain, striated muscle-like [Danaus plexippus]